MTNNTGHNRRIESGCPWVHGLEAQTEEKLFPELERAKAFLKRL
jgi:hypothetical protein